MPRRLGNLAAIVGMLGLGVVIGCGSETTGDAPSPVARRTEVSPPGAKTPSSGGGNPIRRDGFSDSIRPFGARPGNGSPRDPKASPPKREPPTPFWKLMEEAEKQGGWIPGGGARREIDEKKAQLAGIRKISGKRLTLFTDLPSSPGVDELCEVFDAAYPQWLEYFRVTDNESAALDKPKPTEPTGKAKGGDNAKGKNKAEPWRMTGFLMKDQQKFIATGLLPDDLPAFKNGYASGYEFWMNEQPSDYYRRHLMLHEGTHGFMGTKMRGYGPLWYKEGIAELMGTHLWRDKKITLGYFPQSRDEVPYLGRIKLVQDAFARGQARFVEGISKFGPGADFANESYAWCWAVAAMLDGHPRYRQRFRQLSSLVRGTKFETEFRQVFDEDWDQLGQEWQFFVGNIEHGYDFQHTAIEFRDGEPLPSGGGQATIAADRGWQSTGLRLEAGVAYRLTAQGRYQIGEEPKIWWCEPAGVSIRYHNGVPLGALIAAVQPDEPKPGGVSRLFDRTVIGLQGTVRRDYAGTLYLRINEPPSELADNAGSLNVHVQVETE